ncbi:hypothetical protein J5J83_00090 [Azoarcus sp. L1K30]|nr:hypothetical protein [Azoarcus sp. L1K30]
MTQVEHGGRIYVDSYSVSDRVRRGVWNVVRAVAFSILRGAIFNRVRIGLLRLFGAKMGRGCKVAASCRIWTPWTLVAGDYVCLADGVDFYCVSTIRLGSYSTVSQRAFICTASHDIGYLERPLTHAPISVGAHAWVCAEAFVGPGVSIGEGAVVGARAVVVSDVADWAVVAGNPARVIKNRTVAPYA